MLQPLFSGYRRSCIGRCGCRGLCGLWGFALTAKNILAFAGSGGVGFGRNGCSGRGGAARGNGGRGVGGGRGRGFAHVSVIPQKDKTKVSLTPKT